ncbi:MAG: sigma 54-interacting transcriptional regulator, partial [Firmicutes bacterium]|nr:sigma 54-interacting transcriptional regulator [Bacillota bacterium]
MLNIGSLVVDSLDYIMIVDKNYRIIYNTRYDAALNESSPEFRSSDILNKKYFDVYPELKREDSSVVRCVETGQIVIMKKQAYKDYAGRKYLTNNVTFPLTRRGEVVAAVELAMDSAEDVKPDSAIDRKFDEFVMRIQKDAGLITFDKILTADAKMRQAIEQARILSTVPTPILLYGETGTGKEMFAQSIINYSGVPKEKVVIQNCAAVPENLMESILFGTVRGAYTGAENRRGLFEEADGGVLFLDEIGDISYSIQAKLLRVIQDGTFRPLGASEDRRVSVKIIGAMNRDPVKAIEEGTFRSDLFFRFSSGYITLAPLRERAEDIRLFVNHYMDYFSKIYNKAVTGIDMASMEIFMEYDWPGNVRELKNVIETMISGLGDRQELTSDLIPEYLVNSVEKERNKFCDVVE